MGPVAMILVFWMLSFKPVFSLSSFTFIKRFIFSSSLLCDIRVVSSTYLKLLVFLPAILIPACVSSSPACHMMYSAYKLNKQGDNIHPWRSSLPILNQSWHCSMSGSNCCFLSCIQVYVCQGCILSPCLFNFFAEYMSLKSFPCPSLSPRVCSNSCLLSQWCYLTISSSAPLFSFCLQSFPASESFPTSQLFTSVSLKWKKVKRN